MVDGISFTIPIGKITAIIGESGGGKTQTGLALAGLLPAHAKTKITSNPSLDNYVISFIFQDPLNALNPIMRISTQIGEAIRTKLSSKDKHRFLLNLLNELEISDPEKRLRQYPHELSGGMRQRILIAMALARDPDILIADEPATALDVRTKYHIIQLLKQIEKNSNKTIIYITHDLASVKGFADKILIMYSGKIVESGPATTIFKNAKHPYTQKLIALMTKNIDNEGKLEYIEGQPPLPEDFPEGCRFHPRCEFVIPSCKSDTPEIMGSDRHWWKCPVNK